MDLSHYREQSLICRTGKDSKGNEFNDFGTMNAAAWIGENVEPLLNHIDTLTRDNAALREALEASNEILENLADKDDITEQQVGQILINRTAISRANNLEIPKHTFGEGVIVDGISYNIGQWFFDTTGDDCWKIPFSSAGKDFIARSGEISPTISDVRKAVIKQVKYLKNVGSL